MTRPNILLLFTDQQRSDTIHAAGNPIMRTPNLDRIASEGVIFSSAFTPSPVCVSARCSMIHGQYAHNTGCAYNGDDMPTDRPSMMQALTDAGYRTHGIGKMHFRPDPQALRGFQTREHQEEIRSRVKDDDYLQYLHAAGFEYVCDPMGQRSEMYYVPQISTLPQHAHPTNWVGDRTVDFIRRASPDQPFFLFSSFIHPHPPFAPPMPWNKLYRAALMPLPHRPDDCESFHTYINRRQNRFKYRDHGLDDNLLRCMKAYYYACISFIDYQVGRILAALEEAGQLDNTLILYTADHGEFLGDYNCFGKRNMLNPASHVPMLARFPQRFSEGLVCDTPTSLIDVMPTALGAAGVKAEDLALDGVDLASVAADPGSDRAVYSQFQNEGEAIYMRVDREHKLFYSVPDRREYLFDRTTDPTESRNRAYLPMQGPLVAALRKSMFGFYQSQDFDTPMSNGAWRDFPKPPEWTDADEGLGIQEAAWSLAQQHLRGYSD